MPVVEPEYRPACGPLYDPASRNLLFEVTCWRNRINLEVYHSLTDGTGALQFLKTLVCNYLSIKYPQLSEELMAGIQYDASVSERDEDSFLKYYDPHQKIKPVSYTHLDVYKRQTMWNPPPETSKPGRAD